MTESAPNLIEQTPSHPPAHISAVQRCLAARDRSLRESYAEKPGDSNAKYRANDAYRAAMPDLTEYENIRDFIACVTHGMLIETIHHLEAPRLLYAAQVATGALRQAPKEPAKAAESRKSARLAKSVEPAEPESGKTAA